MGARETISIINQVAIKFWANPTKRIDSSKCQTKIVKQNIKSVSSKQIATRVPRSTKHATKNLKKRFEAQKIVVNTAVLLGGKLETKTFNKDGKRE